jgi:hypothetical protein
VYRKPKPERNGDEAAKDLKPAIIPLVWCC